jgi:hypothetical protein
MGKKYTKEQVNQKEWDLWEKVGGTNRSSDIYTVNPYRFARTIFSFYIDPEEITEHAMGSSRQRKEMAFSKFTNPIVTPYLDMEKVVQDFVIDEYTDGDPEKYKSKASAQDIMSMVTGQGSPAGGSVAKPPQADAQQKALLNTMK